MRKFSDDIIKYGWTVVLIKETEYLPSLAYTIGLWVTFNKPEIIAFGLNVNTLHILLNQAADMIKSGDEIIIGKDYSDFFEETQVQFICVDKENISDYFGYAVEYYNSNLFPAIELVWADSNNKFPWNKEFENNILFKQPLLDRNMDFKFYEEKNLGVFTTKQFIENNEPIVYVSHDEDGDWQFLTKNANLKDAKIVHIEYMTSKDKTLNEVFHLEYGQSAERDSIDGNWRFIEDD